MEFYTAGSAIGLSGGQADSFYLFLDKAAMFHVQRADNAGELCLTGNNVIFRTAVELAYSN